MLPGSTLPILEVGSEIGSMFQIVLNAVQLLQLFYERETLQSDLKPGYTVTAKSVLYQKLWLWAQITNIFYDDSHVGIHEFYMQTILKPLDTS